MALYKAKVTIAYDYGEDACNLTIQAETAKCTAAKSVMERVNELRETLRKAGNELKATIANYAEIEFDEKGNEYATPLMTVFYDEETFREGGDYRSWVLTDRNSIEVLLSAFKALTGTKPDVW